MEESYDEHAEYIRDLIELGYINESDLSPIKCSCGRKDFYQDEVYTDSTGIVEFVLKCKYCGNTVGHWAYGSWII